MTSPASDTERAERSSGRKDRRKDPGKETDRTDNWNPRWCSTGNEESHPLGVSRLEHHWSLRWPFLGHAESHHRCQASFHHCLSQLRGRKIFAWTNFDAIKLIFKAGHCTGPFNAATVIVLDDGVEPKENTLVTCYDPATKISIRRWERFFACSENLQSKRIYYRTHAKRSMAKYLCSWETRKQDGLVFLK